MAKKKSNASHSDANAAEPSSDDAPQVDFEFTLEEIEKIVRALESGELTLDASLQQYESAVAKMRQCYRLLEVAERKISVLAGFDADGNPVTAPMENGDSEAASDSLVEKQKKRGQRRGAGSSSTTDAEGGGEL